MTSKKRLLDVTINYNAPTIFEALGMTEERATEIGTQIDNWIDASIDSGENGASGVIENCLDTYNEDPKDLICALFTLVPSIKNEHMKKMQEMMGFSATGENDTLDKLEAELEDLANKGDN